MTCFAFKVLLFLAGLGYFVCSDRQQCDLVELLINYEQKSTVFSISPRRRQTGISAFPGHDRVTRDVHKVLATNSMFANMFFYLVRPLELEIGHFVVELRACSASLECFFESYPSPRIVCLTNTYANINRWTIFMIGRFETCLTQLCFYRAHASVINSRFNNAIVTTIPKPA